MRRGFSLIEALMACFVLFTTIVVSFSVVAQTMRGTSLSESHVRAAYAAHGLLNQERALDFYEVTPAVGSIVLRGVRDGQAYTQTLVYAVDIELLDPDTKRVRATVTWNESAGSRQVILQTVVTHL